MAARAATFSTVLSKMSLNSRYEIKRWYPR
jgi:hypothetical protein